MVLYLWLLSGSVVQLDRMTDSGSVGWGFESLRSHSRSRKAPSVHIGGAFRFVANHLPFQDLSIHLLRAFRFMANYHVFEALRFITTYQRQLLS
jgi:hypothetical protein